MSPDTGDLRERLIRLRDKMRTGQPMAYHRDDQDALAEAVTELERLDKAEARVEELEVALGEIASGCGWMYDDDPEYEPEPEDWWRVVRDLRGTARAALPPKQEED